MIHITNDVSKVDRDGWDYPLKELDYLIEEHDGETFVLIGNRLHEAIKEEQR